MTPLTFEQMAGKQLVLDTDHGAVVIDLRPDLAPNHVGLVMRLVEEAAYNGTIFHRIVKHGVIQGGAIIGSSYLGLGRTIPAGCTGIGKG